MVALLVECSSCSILFRIHVFLAADFSDGIKRIFAEDVLTCTEYVLNLLKLNLTNV